MSRPLPDKEHFRIGEVAVIVGVKTHVLRYWESEFRQLAPKKTRGSHRQFSRRDVEIAMRIKELLHDRGFTVAGAKQRLRETDEHRRGSPSPAATVRAVNLRTELLEVRARLQALLDTLDAQDADEEAKEVVHARVERVIPVSRR